VRRTATFVIALLAFAGLVLILYATSTHVYVGGSDRATAILEGQAVSSGNPLLHGWILTRDSFWTTDAFFYALAVRAGGLWPGLLNLEPAVAVAVAVVVGALVASRGQREAAAELALSWRCWRFPPMRWRPSCSAVRTMSARPSWLFSPSPD
jgi:hypothetical protein